MTVTPSDDGAAREPGQQPPIAPPPMAPAGMTPPGVAPPVPTPGAPSWVPAAYPGAAYPVGAPMPPGGPWGTAPEPERRRSSPGRRAVLLVALILGISLIVGTLAAATGPELGSISGRATATRGASVTSPGGSDPGAGGAGSGRPTEQTEAVEIRGADPDEPTTEVVKAAVAEVDSFWAGEYGRVYARSATPTYRSVSSVNAVDPARDRGICGLQPGQIQGNALYCTQDNSVHYDARGLIPRLSRQYGNLSIAFVVAHEWAHHVQTVSGVPGGRTSVVTLELQADCLAGAWVKHASAGGSYFDTDGASFDRALAGIVKEFKDPVGTDPSDPTVLPHGNAFDRVTSVLDGYRNGAAACVAYTEQSVRSRLTLTPFTSAQDFANQGNLPADQTLEFTRTTLEEYWSTSGREALGARVASPVTLRSEGDRCADAVSTSPDAAWCPSAREVFVAPAGEPARLYRQLGDFAVSMYVAHAYALSALDRVGALSRLQGVERVLAADCLTGAYTKWLFTPNTNRTSGSLSPGDLDEAVGELLTTSRAAGTTGFNRVDAFRTGFRSGIGGADGCRIPS